MSFRTYISLTLLFISFSPVDVTAQKENNNWCLHPDAGINFNTVPPTFFKSKYDLSADSIHTNGVASVSDRNTGALLFYSDGWQVYDSTYNPMPNSGLLRDSINYKTIYNTRIIPIPEHDSMFYILSMHDVIVSGTITYSIINTKLNKNYGDILPTNKAKILGRDFEQPIVVVKGNNCNVWLLLTKRLTNTILAYNVDKNGISSSPIISYVNLPIDSLICHDMKVSPDYSKLCIKYGNINRENYMYIANFDRNTGHVETIGQVNVIEKDVVQSFEFSPNSRYLYFAVNNDVYDNGIAQLDVTFSDSFAIDNSKKMLVVNAYRRMYSHFMQLAPNNKIYMQSNLNKLHVIEQPDLAYPDFNFQYESVTVESSTPRYFVFALPQKNIYADGNEQYSVKTIKEICAGSTDSLVAPHGALKYSWQNGSSKNTLVPNASGKYWVKSTFPCFSRVDTFEVNYLPTYFILGKDTTLCNGETMRLTAKSHPESKYTWQDGSTKSDYIVKEQGVYYVTATNHCGTFGSNIQIDYIPCKCLPFMPDAFTPNNDGVNDKIGPILNCIPAEYKFIVVNRWGNIVFETDNYTKKWDGRHTATPAEGGTYSYVVKLTDKFGNKKIHKGNFLLLR